MAWHCGAGALRARLLIWVKNTIVRIHTWFIVDHVKLLDIFRLGKNSEQDYNIDFYEVFTIILKNYVLN